MNVCLALMLPLDKVATFASIVTASGLYLFFDGFRLHARKRQHLPLHTPTAKISSASLGPVEVSGQAIGPYTLAAPITGTTCFLYRTTAWQQDGSSAAGKWQKVAEETMHVPFFLDDNSGQLLVDPEGAGLELPRDLQQDYSGTIPPQVPAQVSDFLARHGVKPAPNIRIEECCIRPEQALFIVGTVAENSGLTARPTVVDDTFRRKVSGPDAPASLPAREIVRLSCTEAPSTSCEMTQQAKITAALAQAGIQRPETWPAAENPKGGVSDAGDAREATPPPLVLKEGERNPAFLISWRSQQEVARTAAWKSATMMWGGGGLALLGLYVLLTQTALL